jgi:hypothetical protein
MVLVVVGVGVGVGVDGDGDGDNDSGRVGRAVSWAKWLSVVDVVLVLVLM